MMESSIGERYLQYLMYSVSKYTACRYKYCAEKLPLPLKIVFMRKDKHKAIWFVLTLVFKKNNLTTTN